MIPKINAPIVVKTSGHPVIAVTIKARTMVKK
jgi:hypothetical protein